ncbi:MAG: cysteine desulfurase [Candidatus Glassbacteria bacterium]|nr:cysteine desulfurase [Candidatus Glassbacteria bacterium]
MNSPQAVEDRIYLDHNATTPVSERVLAAMLPWLKDGFGNASSIHAEGRAARSAVDNARREVATLLGAAEEEIFFTSGGTESNNLAIFGAVESSGRTGGTLVGTPVEHHAVLRPLGRLEQRGFSLHLLEVDSGGRVDPDALKDLLAGRDDVLLVSVIMANNEVGTVQPVDELAEICRGRGVLFHTDAVQAAGKLPIDLTALPADLLSISGHKLYGPKGVGALFIRKRVKIAPQLLGGSHERKIRAGTENVAGIAGLGEACRLAAENLEQGNRSLADLRDRMYSGLRGKLDGVHLNGHERHRLSNTLNLSFEGVEGEALLLNLDLAGISCSSGSACASGSLEPSHVLTAMGVSLELAQASVRFSLGRSNTSAQIDRAVDEIAGVVTRLRSLKFSF